MRNLLKASFFRLMKSGGMRIAAGITTVAAVAYYILGHGVSTGRLSAEQAGSVAGLGDAMVIWLFGSLMVGMIIGSDFGQKTLHGEIGYGRPRILLHYMIVYVLGMLLLLLPYTLGSIFCIAAGVRMDGAEAASVSVYMDSILHYSSSFSIGKLLLCYLSCTFVYIGQLSICLPVAVKFKKPAVVAAFGFFFGMLTALMAALASKVEMLDNLYKMTPYGYTLSKINIIGTYADLLSGIVVSIIFTGIMGGLSWGLFRRTEIK